MDKEKLKKEIKREQINAEKVVENALDNYVNKAKLGGEDEVRKAEILLDMAEEILHNLRKLLYFVNTKIKG